VAFSPDGKGAVAGTLTGALHLLEVGASSCKMRRTLDTHGGQVHRKAFSPAGDGTFASGADGDTLRIWDFKDGKEVVHVTDRPAAWRCSTLAYSTDGKLLLATGKSWPGAAPELVDPATGERLWDWDGFSGHYIPGALDPKGRYVAIGATDGWIHLFRMPRVKGGGKDAPK
jgi:WD40 repeat protein